MDFTHTNNNEHEHTPTKKPRLIAPTTDSTANSCESDTSTNNNKQLVETHTTAKKHSENTNNDDSWDEDFLKEVLDQERKNLEKRQQSPHKLVSIPPKQQSIPSILPNKNLASPSSVLNAFHLHPIATPPNVTTETEIESILMPLTSDAIYDPTTYTPQKSIDHNIKVGISWIPLKGRIGLFRLRDIRCASQEYSWTFKIFRDELLKKQNYIIGLVTLRKNRKNGEPAFSNGSDKRVQTALVYRPPNGKNNDKELATVTMRNLITYLNNNNTYKDKFDTPFYGIDPVSQHGDLANPASFPVLEDFATESYTLFIVKKLYAHSRNKWSSIAPQHIENLLAQYFQTPLSPDVRHQFALPSP